MIQKHLLFAIFALIARSSFASFAYIPGLPEDGVNMTLNVIAAYTTETLDGRPERKDVVVNQIHHMIAYANNAAFDSNSRVRFKLVDIFEYTTPNTRIDDPTFNRLFYEVNYGNFKQIKKDKSALVVAFFARVGTACGMARIPKPYRYAPLARKPYPTRWWSYHNYGFRNFTSLSMSALFCGSDTFAHEVGHTLGIGHSLRQNSRRLWTYGYGVDGAFHTILTSSYGKYFPGAPLIARYSNYNMTNCVGLRCGGPVVRENAAEGMAKTAIAVFQNQYQGCLVGPPRPTKCGSGRSRCLKKYICDYYKQYTLTADANLNVSRDGAAGEQLTWVIEKDGLIVDRIVSPDMSRTYSPHVSGSNYRVWLQQTIGTQNKIVSNIIGYRAP